MKTLLGALFIGIASLVLYSHVQAGGCCYKSVSVSPGVAGGQAGQFTVSFYDPSKMPNAELFASKPVQIHINNPWPGQTCTLASQSTNDAGEVSGTCTSPSAHAVRFSFTSSALSEDDNKKLSNAIQEIPFSAGPNTTNAPTPTPKPQAEVTTPTPTAAQPQPTSEVPDGELEELSQKVDELQETVNAQGEQLNIIQKLINQILSFVTNLFR